MKLGDRLRECREEQGLTQAALGKIVNVSDAAINRYEKNRRAPDYELLLKLAKLFNVSVDYLLGETNIKTKPDDLAAHQVGGFTSKHQEILDEALKYALKKATKKADDTDEVTP